MMDLEEISYSNVRFLSRAVVSTIIGICNFMLFYIHSRAIDGDTLKGRKVSTISHLGMKIGIKCTTSQDIILKA